MARIRSIKPEFFRHEALFEAERSTGLPLRLAFAGLWTVADREGRFVWSPRNLKLDCLPHDEVDFSAVLDALDAGGFIVRYEVEGKTYGAIPSWHEHQHINQREATSKLPAQPGASTCLHQPSPVTAHGEGKGREGEIKRADARGVVVFDGGIIRLRQKHFDEWTKAFPNIDLRAELTARDAWLGSERATDRDRESWFISTSKYLANRNLEAKSKVAALRPEPHRGIAGII